MIAVFVNMAAVIVGSIIGIICCGKIRQGHIDVIVSGLALITAVIGITGAIGTNDTLCLIVCLVVGTAIGTFLDLDSKINGVGEYIKRKLPKNKFTQGRFTEGLVTASLLFCVGSMSIMGSFDAGIRQDYSIIFAKSAIDFISSIMFGAAMGIGVTCSALFILLFQGSLTLLAGFISPLIGESVIAEMSAVGGTILIGMGINMLELSPKRIKIADMLPGIFLPILYIPLCNMLIK